MVRSMSRPVRGYLPGRPVAACVHRIAPGQAGIRGVSEGVSGRQQVCVGGHQVGLRDPDRGFRTALELGVVGHAADHLAAVVPAGGCRTGIPAMCSTVTVFALSSARRSAPRRSGATWCPGRRPGCPECSPRPGSPPGTWTMTAMRRTSRSAARRCAGPRPSRPAATAPARGSTDGRSAVCPPFDAVSPRSPPAGSSAGCPGSSSSPASREHHRRGSSPWTARPQVRSCVETSANRAEGSPSDKGTIRNNRPSTWNSVGHQPGPDGAAHLELSMAADSTSVDCGHRRQAELTAGGQLVGFAAAEGEAGAPRGRTPSPCLALPSSAGRGRSGGECGEGGGTRTDDRGALAQRGPALPLQAALDRWRVVIYRCCILPAPNFLELPPLKEESTTDGPTLRQAYLEPSWPEFLGEQSFRQSTHPFWPQRSRCRQVCRLPQQIRRG